MSEVAAEQLDEQLCQQFRDWLAQARAEGDRLRFEAGDVGPAERQARGQPPAPIGLHRLIEEFTALRQDVKLQARGARALEEEGEKLQASLRQALEALRTIEPREAQAAWTAGHGLALALAEADEALDRGRKQLDKTVAAAAEMVELMAPAAASDETPDAAPAGTFPEDKAFASEALTETLDAEFLALPFWKRWAARGYHRIVKEALAARERSAPAATTGQPDPPEASLSTPEGVELAARLSAQLSALADGYAMIHARLRRTMAAEGLAPMAALGEMVDPERMIVLAATPADEPPGTVVEEVRRGYIWNGKVLRCAEVRVARAE